MAKLFDSSHKIENSKMKFWYITFSEKFKKHVLTILLTNLPKLVTEKLSKSGRKGVGGWFNTQKHDSVISRNYVEIHCLR